MRVRPHGIRTVRVFPSEDATCIAFANLEAAQRFCEAKVQALPQLRCEIYDAHGLAHPPLLVIVHPDFRHREDSGVLTSRNRKIIAVGLILVSGPLIWLDARRGNTLILPTFLAFNCILTALRFLYWDFGVKQREQGAQGTPGSASQAGAGRCLN